MGRLEVACRRFAILSSITQEADNYATCVHPRGAAGQRRGMLALVTEPAGDHPAFSTGACRLVQDVLVQQYYTDNSLSLTSGLLKAIDSANSALLQYNYNDEIPYVDAGQGPAVAVQGGNVRTRRSQVGLTAVLLRPDGEGIYLAQMSPTQAYITHNGQLSALPEPLSWQSRPGKLAVTLRRVPNHSEVEEGNNNSDLWEDNTDSLPHVALPSLPLGSGPGVEVDLLYRRVEPGDLVVVVSSSLARHLDRPLAEEIFSSGNADQITERLYALATERGLAQSHACVLQLGVEESIGVDTDLTAHVTPPSAESISTNGGAHSMPPGPEQKQQQTPSRFDALRAPKQWLLKLRPTESVNAQPEPIDAIEAVDTQEPISAEAEPDLWNQRPTTTSEAQQPTQVLLQRSLDIPPYKTPGIDESDEKAELEFDGWEDVPPALDKIPKRESAGRRNTTSDGNTAMKYREDQQYAIASQSSTARPKIYPVPTLFDPNDDYADEPLSFNAPSAPNAPRLSAKDKLLPLGQSVAAWVRDVSRNLLPNGVLGQNSPQAGGKPAMLIPARVLIAAGLVILLGVLFFSIYNMTRNPKQREVNQYLTQAQQEDLIANQPSALPSERQTHLAKVLDLAQLALKADPQSKDAALLVQKTQASLDTLQGITRVEPKLLFDLDAADNAVTDTAQGAAQTLTATAAVTSAGQPGALVVQSNDVYVFDKTKGRIYRCRIAARDCAVILKTGDDAGGQKVSALLAMTFRVGNLVALDKNLASFVYSADTSAWQAQPLGGADGLDKPANIASYDGNLYLLAAKPAQISKYAAGSYDKPPADWITDPASVDQMKNPVSLGIDGAVYVLLSDGKILVMQGGKVVRAIPAKANDENPPTLLFTGTDAQDLYLLRPTAGSVTRMTKEGQVRAVFKASSASGVTSLSGMTVDEGSGKLYMLSGRRVYEANLRAPTPGSVAPNVPGQPSARPTALP